MKKKIILTESEIKKLIKNKLMEQSEVTTNDPMVILSSKLLHSQSQSHVFHLQTGSYAEHKALQKFYENIDDMLDELIEAYQGENEIITDYQSYNIVKYEE